MKKSLFTLIAIAVTLFANAQVGSWATKKSLGNDLQARDRAGMVALNGKLYILGGAGNTSLLDFTEYNPVTGEVRKLKRISGSSSFKNLYVVNGSIYTFASGSGPHKYDFQTNNWLFLGALPAGLGPDAGFVINDTLFLASAASGNPFYSYNYVTNTYTQRASYPGTATVTGAFAFELGGKGYWGGGMIGTSQLPTSAFYQYDPITDTWASKASLPSTCQNGIGVSYNGKGYAGLGQFYDNPTATIKHLKFWYEYDPTANTWTKKQNYLQFPDASINIGGPSDAAAAVVGNEIFVFGGIQREYGNNLYRTDDMVKYAVSNDTWQVQKEDMGGNRTEAAGFYANGKIYAGGGLDNEPLKNFYEYDIATNQWTAKSGFNTHHYQRTAVEINGKGYFVGGYLQLNNTYIDSLLEYNPATNQWTAKAPFPGGGRGRVVALTYNNQLYAGMGIANGSPTSDFYRYNPVSNTWSSLANIPFGFGQGGSLSYFTLGDTAYIMTPAAGTLHFYKYSFLGNSWSAGTISSGDVNFAGGVFYTNQAFAFNGKGYVVHGAGTSEAKLSEYNPNTGQWRYVLNTPQKTNSQTIIPTPSGIYFGFGEGSMASDGRGISNEWRELRFNKEVSSHIGLFEPVVAFYNPGQGFPSMCGTGFLNQGTSHSVYDTTGNLFAAVISNTTNLASTCFQVNSRDTLLPYQAMCGNFGHGYNENGMFLNKSVLFPSNSSLPNGGTLRLYYTTSELNKFVQAFNAQYNSNKTIDSIKILRCFTSNNNDLNPLNNGSGTTYNLYSPAFVNYGADKYVELSSVNSSISGELYAVLSAATHRTFNETACGSYFFNGAARTQSGVYKDTLVNATGCDSIITLNLTIKQNTASAQTVSACGSYFFNGANRTQDGVYKDTLANAAGCDSIITLMLTINQPTASQQTASFCTGGSHNFNGTILTQAGTYYDTLTNAAGCDSVITLTLNENSFASSGFSQSICAGESYSFNGQTLTQAGVYHDTLASAQGCDSIVTLTLTVNQPTASQQTASVCAGETYNFNGTLLTQAGTYYDTLTNAAGCDSVITLTLTIKSPSASSFAQAICAGESYSFNSETLTQAGTYFDTLLNATGCDSIVTLTLTVNQPSASQLAVAVCTGGSYNFNGTTFTQTGTYYDTLTNAAGCDSIITLNLNVNSFVTGSISAAICHGESYAFNGQQLTQDGSYNDTLVSSGGCDSIVTLTLTVNALPQPTVTENGNVLSTQTFDSYQWILNGSDISNAQAQSHTAVQSGDYSVRVTDANGCEATSAAVNVTITGIESLPQTLVLQVYPNPFGEAFVIESNTAGPLTYTVFDASGKVIASQTFTTKTIVDMTAYAAGSYIVSVSNQQNQSSSYTVVKR